MSKFRNVAFGIKLTAIREVGTGLMNLVQPDVLNSGIGCSKAWKLYQNLVEIILNIYVYVFYFQLHTFQFTRTHLPFTRTQSVYKDTLF